MLKETLIQIFNRDLPKLKEEIKLYKNENDLWLKKGTITNSAGNLVLHLNGNLNHFIGFGLGKTDYTRNRDAEFSIQFVSREELLKQLDETINVVNDTLSKMNEEDFEKPFPLEKQGEIFSTTYMLLHLLAHLCYHLGQINYHRRMIQGA